jgi:DNA repair exonuclease SbcCD ATPase subunit
MRFLSTLVIALLAITPLAFGHSTHRTHIVDTDGNTEIRIVRESDGESWASLKRDGVRYVTTDPAVLAEIEKATEKRRELSREHSSLGRRHSELGREHSQLGREHSRLGREHSRLSRAASRDGGTREVERRQRELEEEQRKLEEKQRQLEVRQNELEQQQHEIEARQRIAERESYRALEQIFDRAVREGKAKRD